MAMQEVSPPPPSQTQTTNNLCKSDSPALRLAALGMDSAAQTVKKAKEANAAREKACEKWALAYAHYKFLTPEQIAVFRGTLEGIRDSNGRRKSLALTPLKQYPNVPPNDVLDALETAQGHQVFDSYEVAHIEWIAPVPDPILFGRIAGCPDYFVIAQWGDDVSVQDILAAGK